MFEEKKCQKSVNFSDIPKNAVIMGMRFVFKLKRFADGTIERYKARLVARGFMQIHGVHYVDSFSPTANIVSSCSPAARQLLLSYLLSAACQLLASCWSAARQLLASC